MSILTPSKLIAFGILAILACASGAQTRKNGQRTRRNASGSARRPYVTANVQLAGGSKIIQEPVGPAQYGTPGCPYPSFGGCKPGETQGTILGRTVCCPPGQEFVANVGCREPKPKETTPEAPTPETDSGIKVVPKSDIFKKFDPTGGCGKGMHKGGDGQCYPNLN
jgi:hypothetical protein